MYIGHTTLPNQGVTLKYLLSSRYVILNGALSLMISVEAERWRQFHAHNVQTNLNPLVSSKFILLLINQVAN
jgi:hypothetical protein